MFSRKTVKFLNDLSSNNNRVWFDQNKERYEDEVRGPALEYIQTMAEPLRKISPHFIASPKKVGGSLMRVHRDIRFSKDKTPYKTNIGIQFRHERGKDVHAPGFYLHIEPGDVFIAGGIWHPDSPTLKNVRMLMDEHQAEWKKLTRKLVTKDGFELQGDTLKRPPAGYAIEHPLIEDLKRKDFIAVQSIKVSSVYAKDFVAQSSKLFRQCAPLVKFVCEANDLEF
ncbi:MAG: DUF2461 domain-containing protein [Gammaproteobacteria bacterium]|nr:DUF2461 domain-containing protein [Gammaproteobacteria bacterium]